METLQEREDRIKRLDAERAQRHGQISGVWPTPDDAGTGVVPLEIAPGRGNLLYTSSGFLPTFPTALSLIGNRTVSFARLFMSQPWVAAAVMRMLTWAVRAPLKAYRRTGDNPADKQRLRPGDHVMADAIVRPWDKGSQANLIVGLLGSLLVHGNSLAEVLDGVDTLQFVLKDWRFSWPIMPFRDTVEGWKFDVDSPEYMHEVSVDTALHMAWWSPTGPIGVSPLQQLGVTLQIEDAAQRHQRALLANGAQPPSAITASEDFLGIERDERQQIMAQLRQDITDLYSGPENNGKPALLPPGLDWKSIGLTSVEAQLIDQRKIAREEIAGVYQIPPPLLGILDRACLPADALISTERGPIPAAEVKVGDRVFAAVDGKLKLSEVSWSRQTGMDPIVTVRTTNRTLRCSDNHPLLVARRIKGDRTKRKVAWRHEWVPAGHLKVDDLIVTAEKFPDYGVRSCPTRDDVSVGFAEFCGLLLGDGNVKYDDEGQPAGIGIARAAGARYMDHYRAVMKAEFRQLARGGRIERDARQRLPIRLAEQERQTRFSSREAAEEMVELGLAGTAHTKRVPEWVGALAPDLRAAFVRGFADADGSVDKNGHLSLHSANEVMLRQLRELCIGLGVPVSNVRASRSWVTLPNGEPIFSVMWQFKATDPVANATIISSHDPVDRARMENGKPWGRKRYAYRGRASNGPPRIEGCGHARVRSIERGEVSVPVYDIEVPDGHNFVVEGVLTHNTYSNIQTQRDMTYTDCLGPPLILMEQSINAQIIRELLREDDVFVEFDFGEVLRGDRLQEIQSLRDAIGSGLMTPNEGRSVINLQASDADGMDKFWMPFNNLQPVGSPPVPGLVPAVPGDTASPDSARRLHVRSRDRDYAVDYDAARA